MSDCPVCCCSSTHKIRCSGCGYNPCGTCVYQYLSQNPFQLECMSCKMKWESSFLLKHLEPKEIKGLCSKRKEIHQRRSNNSMKKELASKYKELKKKRQQITKELRMIKELMKQSDGDDGFILFCPNSRCKGGKVLNNRCLDCETEICDLCKLESHGDQPCVPVRNIEMIKSCPGCKSPIYRESGCSQMFCTFCNSGFLWNTRELISRVENPHFWKAEEDKRLWIERLQQACQDKDNKWIFFLNFVMACEREHKLLIHRGKTEKQKFANDAFSDRMLFFAKRGRDLMKSFLENPKEKCSQDWEMGMYTLMKEMNDEFFYLGEKLKVSFPRVLGWKIIYK